MEHAVGFKLAPVGPRGEGSTAPASPATPRTRVRPAWVPGRAMRVCILLSVIIALSLIDLYLTLLYVTHTGMDEANPLARALLRYSSLETVALFKAASVGLCAFILFRARWTRVAEIGAWLGAVILILLTARWMDFGRHQAVIAQAASIYSVQPEFTDGSAWVDRRHSTRLSRGRAG